MSYAVEVIADRSGKFCGNGVRFATREEAERRAEVVAWSWTLVEEWRVVESDDPVNYTLDENGGLVPLAERLAPTQSENQTDAD